MKMKIIFCLAAFLGLCVKGQAQFSTTNVTLFVAPNGNPNQTNASYSVQSGQTAKIVFETFGGDGALHIGLNSAFYNNATATFPLITSNSPVGNLPVIVGPATISVTRNNSGNPIVGTNDWAFCTIEVSAPNTASSSAFVPSTAVVIPADSGGSVNIILESSSDLINWYPSLPGTYGANYTNRFFRVRAQLAQ